jgi:hypothetical protein
MWNREVPKPITALFPSHFETNYRSICWRNKKGVLDEGCGFVKNLEEGKWHLDGLMVEEI